MEEKSAFQIYVALFIDNFEIEKMSRAKNDNGYNLLEYTTSIIRYHTYNLPPDLQIRALDVMHSYLSIESIYESLKKSRTSEEMWNLFINVVRKHKIPIPQCKLHHDEFTDYERYKPTYSNNFNTLHDFTDLYKEFATGGVGYISIFEKKKIYPPCLCVIKYSAGYNQNYSTEAPRQYILEQMRQIHHDE